MKRIVLIAALLVLFSILLSGNSTSSQPEVRFHPAWYMLAGGE